MRSSEYLVLIIVVGLVVASGAMWFADVLHHSLQHSAQLISTATRVQ